MATMHIFPVDVVIVLSTNFHLIEFDQLRAVSRTMDQRFQVAERRLLRRTVYRLAVATQSARYVLLGIIDSPDWSRLLELVSWVGEGIVGRVLESLHEQLHVLHGYLQEL